MLKLLAASVFMGMTRRLLDFLVLDTRPAGAAIGRRIMPGRAAAHEKGSAYRSPMVLGQNSAFTSRPGSWIAAWQRAEGISGAVEQGLVIAFLRIYK
jgi:hypothetical protein